MTSISQRQDGLYWPDCDQHACYSWTHAEIEGVRHMVASCVKHRNVVHAGANVGAYALKFSECFDNVYACEPDRTNFRCLCANTAHVPNVWPLFVALGQHAHTVSITNDQPHNCGTPHVQGAGAICQIPIDALNLCDVDLIHLDTEGYELFVLQGAKKTIQTYDPLIVVEWLNHGVKYGYQQQDVTQFLFEMGYTHMKAVGSDMMFKK